MNRFLLILLLLTSRCFAQTDTTADFVAYWKKGEQKLFRVELESSKSEKGKLTSSMKMAYEVKLRILDSSENEYKLEWITRIPEADKARNPDLAKLPVYNGMRIIYTTNELGEFKELLNWTEVRDAYVKMMRLSMPQKQDEAGLKAMENAISLFNNKEMVSSALIKEVHLFHCAYGIRFSTTVALDSTSFPNPLGGEPLPAISSYQIRDYNEAQEQVTVVMRTELDSKGAHGFIMDVFKKMELASIEGYNESSRLLTKLSMYDSYEVDFMLKNGWVKRAYSKRAIDLLEKNKTDEYTITLLK